MRQRLGATGSGAGSLPSGRRTSLATGDVVVDPRHGVVVVQDFETRHHDGRATEYVIFGAANGLTIRLPRRGLASTGIRPLISAAAASRVLGALREPAAELPGWSPKTLKELRVKAQSGVPMLVAELLRDLAAKRRRKGLAKSEEELRSRATEILATELALVLGDSKERATARITEALSFTEGES